MLYIYNSIQYICYNKLGLSIVDGCLLTVLNAAENIVTSASWYSICLPHTYCAG